MGKSRIKKTSCSKLCEKLYFNVWGFQGYLSDAGFLPRRTCPVGPVPSDDWDDWDDWGSLQFFLCFQVNLTTGFPLHWDATADTEDCVT